MAFYATHHEACDPASFMFSPKLSLNYTPPSSQHSMGSLQQVFGPLDPYAALPCYDAPVYAPLREPLVSYVPHQELLAMDRYQFNPAYPCVSPPDLQIPSSQPAIPPQTYSIYHSPLVDAKNQILLPAAPELLPADPPKRKGDRALARLHRSAVDPDRHWACDHCIQKFARKSDLTRHLKRHAGRKDYPCTAPSCPLPVEERAFFRADARRRHWSKSPSCEVAFYKTPEGVAWSKKNGNRRGVLLCREGDEDQSDGSESPYTE